MRLRTRPLRGEDFPSCWPLISNGFAYSEAMAKTVPDAWQRLLADKAMLGVVIEDLDRPANEQVMAFGATVFVRHSWVKEALSDPAPYLPARVITGYRKRDSPILKRPQIARANAARGLALLVVHHGWRKQGLTGVEQFGVQQAMMKGYADIHCGYQLRVMLNEAYGEEELAWTLNGGNHELARDYRPYIESRRMPLPAHMPYLIIATRERASKTLATVTSQMFRFTHPRIGYSQKQQDLLELALRAGSDRQAATALAISEDAVARRWRGVFRLSMADVEVRVAVKDAEAGLKAPSTRKRHILMEILRGRPEELRPWHRPTARRNGWDS